MKLRLVCPEKFVDPEEICKRIMAYFPNLIYKEEVIRTGRFNCDLEVAQVEKELEELLSPNWKREVVINLIPGRVFIGKMEIRSHGYPLNDFTRNSPPALFKIKSLKKGGHLLLNNLTSKGLDENVEYLTKLGVEQFHRRLGILPHDEDCFSFYDKSRDVAEEKLEKDFCPQCRKFMRKLSDPLDQEKIARLKREIYPDALGKYWEFKRLVTLFTDREVKR